MTAAIKSIKLSEVLDLVPKPIYVLGTTYTLSLAFFEAVVPFIDRSSLNACLIRYAVTPIFAATITT